MVVEMRNNCKIVAESLRGRDHSEDLVLIKDNIKMDLWETGTDDVGWFHLFRIWTGGGLLWTR
jgi:hypothetical protein